MKALLLKDWYLIEKQLKMYGAMVLFAIGFTIYFKNTSFALTYMIILSSSVLLASISYDEMDNSFPALLCLPITRKQYVQSKYFASILMFLLNLCIMGTVTFFVHKSLDEEFMIVNWISEISVAFFVFCMLTSITLPLQLKFGVEKARSVMFVSYIGILAFIFLIYTAFEKFFKIDWMLLLTWLNNHLGLAFGALLMVGAGLYLLSYGISLKIFSDKEF